MSDEKKMCPFARISRVLSVSSLVLLVMFTACAIGKFVVARGSATHGAVTLLTVVIGLGLIAFFCKGCPHKQSSPPPEEG